MDKFNNKYRIPSARLHNWDYGSNGSYFITICTQNREHFFGEIIGEEMHLSEMGKMAENFWKEIPHHFPFIELGNFVIMPNHTHGILIIDNPVVETRFIASSFPDQPSITSSFPDQPSIASSFPDHPNKKLGGITGNNNPMFHDSISRL